jgi:carboxylate-amine ligase
VLRLQVLWWDVRPHPRLGTLEIRALDAQSSLDDLAGLVALAHCLAAHEATAPSVGETSAEVLREFSFRACRDGLEAQLLLGTLRPARELACHAIELASAYAADLGCWDELMGLHALVETGNGATRQRRHEPEGGLRLLLRRLADETVRGSTATSSTSSVIALHDTPGSGSRQVAAMTATAGAAA